MSIFADSPTELPGAVPPASLMAPIPDATGAGTELVQLLTPEGERVEHPTFSVDLTDQEYRDLYRDLVLVRRIDVEATALQRQGELGLWASLLGQEAAQVGSGRAMRRQDFAFPTYREHGVAWCRDVDPLTLLGLFRGVTNGGWDPQEHRFLGRQSRRPRTPRRGWRRRSRSATRGACRPG